MTNHEIEQTYKMIQSFHKRYLEHLGISLPRLKNSKNNYIKDSLVLVFLAHNYPNNKEVTKESLTTFIKKFYPDTNDVQQARHLSRQKGWYIVSGRRGDISEATICPSCYKLISLEKPYPNYNTHRLNNLSSDDWNGLKKLYNYRCASCGSVEGQPNFINKSATTQLQKGHMNPTKPLEIGNIIPQCQECNRGDRNRWIYNEQGRVVGITDEELLQRIKKIKSKNLALQIIKYLTEKFLG